MQMSQDLGSIAKMNAKSIESISK